MPAPFRESLIRETGLVQFDIRSPLDLRDEYRSERWTHLCSLIEEFDSLDGSERDTLGSVLVSLCLYEAVTDLIPELGDEAVRTQRGARLAYLRATARYVLWLDFRTPYSMQEFQRIAELAPPCSTVRINAMLHMMVQSARDYAAVEAVEYWAKAALEELEAARAQLTDFDYQLFRSRYWRGAAFAPQLRGDRRGVVKQMDEAEALAVGLVPSSADELLLAQENLHPLLESRTKEALWLGDRELALERALRLVEIDQHDPKPLIELGEVYVARDQFDAAADTYLRAARYGPPGTAMAYFMGGQCNRALGEVGLARHCYLQALKVDPLSVSALEELTDPEIADNRAIQEWARERLALLQSAQQAHSLTGSI